VIEGTGAKGAVLYYLKLQDGDGQTFYKFVEGIGWEYFSSLYNCTAEVVGEDEFKNANCTQGKSGWEYEESNLNQTRYN